MIKHANFELIFTIRGLKLDKRDEFSLEKNSNLLFPRMIIFANFKFIFVIRSGGPLSWER